MPELPEVESARRVISRAALRRRIVAVDDSDRYVCRPHSPGELRDALVGRAITAAHRVGKSIWCDIGSGRSGGPTLGVHLGMSGKIVVADRDGTEIDGGDRWEGRRQPGDYQWSRFSLEFADGGRLMLVDPRRLGRIRLDPPVDRLGPDAGRISPAQFRAALSHSTAPVKARLLDQHVLSGIGNLLADQILWVARVHPARPVDSLTRADVDRLQRATRRVVKVATQAGGVHVLSLLPYRHAGAQCPRDGAPMVRSTVGGRTSWWCADEQAATG